MSEPSKEALRLAEACLDGRELRDGIAVALQKLMDERDDSAKYAAACEAGAAHWKQRAEAAEEQLGHADNSLAKMLSDLGAVRERAELAEAERDAIMCASNNQAARILELEKRCEYYRRCWDDEKVHRLRLEQEEGEKFDALIHELRKVVRLYAITSRSDGGPIAALKELLVKYDPTGEL